MKLLVIAPYPPTPPLAGGRRRILEELRFLSANHEIDLACLTYHATDEAQLLQLNLPIVRIFTVRQINGQNTHQQPYSVGRFWNRQLLDLVATLTQTHEYDWVLAEHCYAAVYLEGVSARKMLTEHNIEYRILEQLSCHDTDLSLAFSLTGRPGELYRNALQELPLLRRFEEETWTRMDVCVTVSENERRVVAEVADQQILHVAPNCPGFPIQDAPLRPGSPSIVFIGALNYFPNVDAIIDLTQAILPLVQKKLPGVDVLVGGRDPSRQLIDFCSRAGVRLTANPVSFIDLVTSGSVMVCPLRFGAGTRIKVLDAMAVGLPVVATSVAVEGLGTIAGRDLLVGDSPHELSELVVELLNSGGLRATLAEAGREFLRGKELRWPAVFANLERRLEMALR